MNVLQTQIFKRQTKKLHKKQKMDLDKAIMAIIDDPSIGDVKKGDLNGIRVYKFKMVNQLVLVAYDFYASEMKLIMLAFGVHENFYRNLKKK